MTAEKQITGEICRLAGHNPAGMIVLSGLLNAGGERGVLLWLCAEPEDVCASDIVDHFGLTAGRVANILRMLEKRGCIERRADAVDHRILRIVVTEEGRTRAAEEMQELTGQWSKIIQRLGRKDSEKLLRLLQRMLEE